MTFPKLHLIRFAAAAVAAAAAAAAVTAAAVAGVAVLDLSLLLLLLLLLRCMRSNRIRIEKAIDALVAAVNAADTQGVAA